MSYCWRGCLIYSIFFFNFLFALIGLTLIGIGSYLQIHARHYFDFLSNTFINTPLVVIVLGITVFLISFLACFGAISESSFLIFSYSVLLTFILMGQFAGGITAFIMKKNLSEGNRIFFKQLSCHYLWELASSTFLCVNKQNFGIITLVPLNMLSFYRSGE